MRVCSFEGCEKKHLAKGYCQGHYDQLRRGQQITVLGLPKETRICSFDGCEKKHEAKGYCQGHYIQLSKGVPLRPLGRVSKYKGVICSVDGCDKQVLCRYLCASHYGEKRISEGYVRPPPSAEMKESRCIYAKQWYADRILIDPEYAQRKLESLRRWRAENPEAQRQASQRWKENNPERVRENNRRWRANNDQSARLAEWSRNNRNKRRASYDKWRGAQRGATSELINRKDVWERDQGICGICLLPAETGNWHLDHIIPLSREGPHTMDNVQVSHPLCNLRKGSKLMEELV